MVYLMWLVLIILSFAVDLAGLLVVPIAIALSDGRTLPRWAWAWDNDREPLGDVDRRADIEAASGLWRGFLRWRWLCLRNPGNNFGYSMGFVQSPDVTYQYAGDPETSDFGRPGWLFVRAYRNGELSAFCFYGIWKSWIPGKCRRVFLGWKIHDMVRDGTPAQLVAVYNPVMTFTD